MKKSYIIVIGIILIATVIGGGMYLKSNQQAEVAPPPTITGEVACLPLKNPNDGVNDAMCKKGIKNEAGLYLEVESMPQEDLELGKKVEVKGELKPADPNSKYQIVGTIK
jgi:hypothetical protein